MRAEDRSTERGTVSWLVRRYVASRTDITEKAQQQYAWAIPHIENGLGAIPLATLDQMAADAGLALAHRWADYRRTPFDPQGSWAVSVYVRAPDRRG